MILSSKQTIHQIYSSYYNASSAFIIAVLFYIISSLFKFKTLNPRCSNSESKTKTIVSWTFGFLCVILVTFLITALQFIYNKFGQLDTDIILFQLQDFAGQERADQNDMIWVSWYFKSIFVYAELASVVLYTLTMFYLPMQVSLRKKFQRKLSFKIKFNISANIIHIVHAILLVNIVFTAIRIPTLRETKFFEENYVDPKIQDVIFPEKKRNLIVFVLESYESTYAAKEAGGYFQETAMPNMQANALNTEKYLHFSQNEKVGGAHQVPGTSWSIAGMFAMECGLPIRVSYSYNYKPDPNKFLPGAHCLGEILRDNGYHGAVFYGTPAEYQRLDVAFKSHGADEILDSFNISTGGWTKDYQTIGFAKKHIEKLAASGKPFYAMVDTFDNHFNGHICPQCNLSGNNSWHCVIKCVDRQANEFIKWFESSAFYHNTTLIFQGDHLTLNGPFNNEMSYNNYLRTTYNLYVNSAIKTEHSKNRKFTMMDIYPTILASIGAKIRGNRLGLGTNLFAGDKTIIEKYGVRHVINELNKQSDWYDTNIAKMVKEPVHVQGVASWGTKAESPVYIN
ncbi:hypothetical protein TVAG_410910 [Trichomonas vaginalis G3]|uniref:Sulfatase N-terminal domain-containing protein n=1 Tax=Trichomonas vaginalis (strain ATCC PRA-98 / G3) TaxID=412133 RepID=A2DXJ6_TRIV3|nr:sulfatase family [Trichomonas vaginalis G3]EAY14825.1 hypothetical protein TVAG_410910 [Trichomonas vaginalis G3]KAI5541194.1 sulfatase family [Trichomonas vaginalis G3]|eukprot:XP_001327048.1 hypothetical protein [Trichomonas vaginalis G3]